MLQAAAGHQHRLLGTDLHVCGHVCSAAAAGMEHSRLSHDLPACPAAADAAAVCRRAAACRRCGRLCRLQHGCRDVLPVRAVKLECGQRLA